MYLNTEMMKRFPELDRAGYRILVDGEENRRVFEADDILNYAVVLGHSQQIDPSQEYITYPAQNMVVSVVKAQIKIELNTKTNKREHFITRQGVEGFMKVCPRISLRSVVLHHIDAVSALVRCPQCGVILTAKDGMLTLEQIKRIIAGELTPPICKYCGIIETI